MGSISAKGIDICQRVKRFGGQGCTKYLTICLLVAIFRKEGKERELPKCQVNT